MRKIRIQNRALQSQSGATHFFLLFVCMIGVLLLVFTVFDYRHRLISAEEQVKRLAAEVEAEKREQKTFDARIAIVEYRLDGVRKVEKAAHE